jgi:DNA repair protein RadC
VDGKGASVKYDFVSERTGPEARIRVPKDVLPVLGKYHTKQQEHFIVVTLRGDHTVIRARIISIGLVNRTLVHPREVFLTAIKDNAVAIIIAHNHPSGDVEPSTDDFEVTRRLVAAGELIGITVLDHIVFARGGRFISMTERGQMPMANRYPG